MNAKHVPSNPHAPRHPVPGGLASILILIAALAGLAAAGCGKSKSESTPTAEVVSQERAADPASQAPQAQSDSAANRQAVTGGGEHAGDPMPPEIAVSAPDSVLAPGAIVEISAHATTDVVEMTLRDDLGRQQPFAYDSGSKIWQARYRVPLRLSGDRLALSVTARNGAGQWRRAWISLVVSSGAN